ncbi:MAG: hypothetical protein GY754_37340 [bacterium]|nr:hypothetical protein [bacterium]
MGIWGEGLLTSLAQRLNPGDSLLVIGGSGQGKTTLINDLADQLTANEKKVFLLGADTGLPAWGPPACLSLVNKGQTGDSIAIAFTGSLDPLRSSAAYFSALSRFSRSVPPDSVLLVEAPGIARERISIPFITHLVAAFGPRGIALLTGNPVLDAAGEFLKKRDDLFLEPVAPSPNCAVLSKQARLLLRTAAFDRFQSGARETPVYTGNFEIIGKSRPVEEWKGSIVGFLGSSGETLALGEIRGVEETVANVITPLSSFSNVSAIFFGDLQRSPEGTICTRPPAETKKPKRAGLPAPWIIRERPNLRIPISWPVNNPQAAYEVRMLNSLFGDPGLLLRRKGSGRAMAFDLGWLEPMPAKVLHDITDIFISHAHMDHLQGIVTFLRMMMAGKTLVRIYGPPGIDANIEGLLRLFRFNLLDSEGPGFIVHAFDGSHIDRTEFRCTEPLVIKKKERLPAAEGLLLDEGDTRVRAFLLEHSIPVLGYRCESRGFVPPGPGEKKPHLFTLAYITDAGDCPHNRDIIIKHARDVDLLVCESMFAEDQRERALKTGHFTARAAAEIAAACNVGRLIPFHFSPRYIEDPGIIYREILPIFDRVIPAVEDTGSAGL